MECCKLQDRCVECYVVVKEMEIPDNLKSPVKLHTQHQLGSISPTLWSKAQMGRPSEFGTKDTIQFHHQNFTLLYMYTQLEVTHNVYALHSMLYASKMSVNLMAQNLLINCWLSCHIQFPLFN